MTSTYIAGGEDSLEDLLRGAEGGIYIPDYFHGSGMSTFTIAPARAYRIRNGKVAEPVRVSVISGNVMETLFKIDGATKEVELCPDAYGGCGKMEQSPLRISLGGPYIRVCELNVQ
jgi:TldD protein